MARSKHKQSAKVTIKKTKEMVNPGSIKMPVKRGTRVLQEIRKCQMSTEPLVPQRPFQRIVREISEQLLPGCRYQSSAIKCLQEASEACISQVMENANLCAVHAGRVTIQVKDIKLACRMNGLDKLMKKP